MGRYCSINDVNGGLASEWRTLSFDMAFIRKGPIQPCNMWAINNLDQIKEIAIVDIIRESPNQINIDSIWTEDIEMDQFAQPGKLIYLL